MPTFRVSLTITFWLLNILAVAQLRVQNFGIAEGLPQSQAQAMAEDAQGYLWIGTLGGGLSRFDGVNFENYTTTEGLINNLVSDIHIDHTNRIWLATTKGISMFDGVAFHNHRVGGREGVYVNSLFPRGNDIMYLTRDGEIGKVWYDSAVHSRALGTIHGFQSIRKVTEGNTFILQQSSGDTNLLIFGDRDSVVLRQADFRVIHSTFFYKGSQLLSTNSGLFLYHSKGLSKLLDVTTPVYSFDDARNYFVGVGNGSIAAIDLNGKLLPGKDPVKYLILSSLKDREGNLWLGTDQGIFKVRPYTFVNPLTDQDRDDAVLALQYHNNQLWVGTTYKGIKVYENNKLIKSYNLGSKLRNFVNTIAVDHHNKLWVGTLGGLAVIENGEVHWRHEDLIRNSVAIDFDKDNNALVAGAPQGLFHIENEIARSIPEFQTTGVWCVKYNRDHDYFVVGTDVGLRIIEKGKLSSRNVSALDGYQISSLSWINSHTLAMGTFGDGMLIYSFQKNTLDKINVLAGLVSNTIFSVFKDSAGIWVGTEKGIDLIHYDASNSLVSGIDHFDDQDGLLGLETNLNAVIQKDSTLLFGLVKGLFQYKAQKNDVIENRIHLTGVNLFNKTYHDETMNHGFTLDTSLVYSFQPGQNHLTFFFNKVNKRKSNTFYFTFKLTDFDQIWSPPSLSRHVTYSNLAPGTYTLQVRATDKAGAFIYDKTSFHFIILPAFHQTTSFRISMVVLVIALLWTVAYAVTRIKANRAMAIQQIRNDEQARLRKEIARDFHDELGNQVARMINYVGLLRISQKMDKEIYQTLNTYSQTILTGAKDFVWALDPGNNDLGSVLIHLKDFGERMFSEKNIRFSFHGHLPDTRLPAGYGRQINLIFKEAMTNAFKHANARSVDFTFTSISSKELSISLRDDGTGIDKARIQGSENGLENMKVRAQKINSSICIASDGQGTEIRLDVILPDTIY